ncbi:MAG: M23 family metallopeptidase [Verrucomicrobiia bacterium]
MNGRKFISKYSYMLKENKIIKCTILLIALFQAIYGFAQPFYLPTPNTAIFDWKSPEKYYVPTPGRSWESGTFGCVRSDGYQMHEGIDIRCIYRDKHNRPIDPIYSTADGQVVYINDKPSLSNYGKYIVIRHYIDGIEIYSLYAHLSGIRPGLKPGSVVKAGENIGVMGTTANTRQPISLDRAHLHFELNMFINDKFPFWFKARYPNERNNHGVWNGLNMLGLDPRAVFLTQRRLGKEFNLADFIRNQTELFAVFVQKTDFPYIKRYPSLIMKNPKAELEGIAGYEISFNFNGIPIKLIPRAPSEAKGFPSIKLLRVNAEEQKANPCRRLVIYKNSGWQLSNTGLSLIELLTY